MLCCWEALQLLHTWMQKGLLVESARREHGRWWWRRRGQVVQAQLRWWLVHRAHHILHRLPEQQRGCSDHAIIQGRSGIVFQLLLLQMWADSGVVVVAIVVGMIIRVERRITRLLLVVVIERQNTQPRALQIGTIVADTNAVSNIGAVTTAATIMKRCDVVE